MKVCTSSAAALRKLGSEAAPASPRQANEKYAFALSSTLAEDGTPDDGAYDQVCKGERALLTEHKLTFCRAATEKRSSTSLSMSCMVRCVSLAPGLRLELLACVLTGKVFKIAEDRSSTPPKIEVYASFGGLLMLLKVSSSRSARRRCGRTNSACPAGRGWGTEGPRHRQPHLHDDEKTLSGPVSFFEKGGLQR